MASDGNRTIEIPSIQRYTFLRTGVRIRLDEPCDAPQPDGISLEEYIQRELNESLTIAFERMNGKFNTWAKILAESMLMPSDHNPSFKNHDETAAIFKKAFKDHDDSATTRGVRNDGKFKRRKQMPPGYVNLTKRRRY